MISQLLADTFTHVSMDIVAFPKFWDASWWLQESPLKEFVLPLLLTIIFIETGLLFPLLPGDSLLFVGGMVAAGTMAAGSTMHIGVLLPAVILTAIAGDQCGYFIGRTIGPAIFDKEDSRFFKKHYITKSHEFFEKYGTKTIILARFVPIVRTFMPVLAGASQMSYRKYLAFDIVGGLLWAGGITTMGYFLGNVEFIQKHVEGIAIVIVLVSVSPALVHLAQRKFGTRAPEAPAPSELTS